MDCVDELLKEVTGKVLNGSVVLFFAVENSSFEVYGLSFIEQFLEFHAVMIRVNITSFRLIFTMYCYIRLTALFNSKMIIYRC